MLRFEIFLLGFFFFLLTTPAIFAQTYPIDNNDGQTITTCGGTFTDSGNGGFGDYGNNENYTVTFCSGSTDYLRFIINPNITADAYQIQGGDTLFVYDGTGTAGALLASYSAGEDPGSNLVVLESTSSCATFNFISNASTDGNGWEIGIECIPEGCGTNPDPADDFANAPYVCNFDGYCASTSGYTEDEPFNFEGGGDCPVIFGGTIENNSWLAFEASGPNITFQIDVIGCYGAFGYVPDPSVVNYGIQAAILSFDGSNFTRVSDCNLSDGQQLSLSLSNTTALTTGGTYYLVVDGSSGSVCDYSINVAGDAQVMDAGADQTICNGSSATLTASGPAGATYSWEAVGGGFGPTAGNPVIVSPTVTTEYVVEVTTGGCSSQTDTVEVVVNTCACSIDDITAGNQTNCVSATNQYTQEVIVSYTGEPGTGTLDVNGTSVAITGSPQTVTLTGLTADGNAVNVTANFSALPSCIATENSLFTAPASCSVVCAPDNGAWD